jgi:hypothetical protein
LPKRVRKPPKSVHIRADNGQPNGLTVTISRSHLLFSRAPDETYFVDLASVEVSLILTQEIGRCKLAKDKNLEVDS